MTIAEKLEDYRRDGIVVLRGAVPPVGLAELLRQFHEVFRHQIRRHGISHGALGTVAFEDAIRDLFAADMKSYLAAAKATQNLPALHALGTSGPVLDLVRGLGIGAPMIAVRPVVHILAEALKVPGGYHRTPPHQDWRSVQGSLNGLVVWLPLVPVDREFGALEVLPGSHLGGLRPSEPHAFGNVVPAAEINALILQKFQLPEPGIPVGQGNRDMVDRPWRLRLARVSHRQIRHFHKGDIVMVDMAAVTHTAVKPHVKTGKLWIVLD